MNPGPQVPVKVTVLPPGPVDRKLYFDRIQFPYEHHLVEVYGPGPVGYRTRKSLTGEAW